MESESGDTGASEWAGGGGGGSSRVIRVSQDDYACGAPRKGKQASVAGTPRDHTLDTFADTPPFCFAT